MQLLSGRTEGLPYSLSRWTDVPAVKWHWLKERLRFGWMEAFDQRTSMPGRWSLDPEDTLGLVFWTKNPKNLIRDYNLLEAYKVKIHLTATGWEEAELHAPKITQACDLLKQTVDIYGLSNVRWRFSPIPLLPEEDLLRRFGILLQAAADCGLNEVYVSFLQENDLVPDTRSLETKVITLAGMAKRGNSYGVTIRMCNDDQTLGRLVSDNLTYGVCAPPEDFGLAPTVSEGCGCALMVDPFTITEECQIGCTYCYAGAEALSPRRNTTKRLPIVR